MELSEDLDTHGRQQVIDGFLASLSSWDLLYLRRRMHHHESRIRLASLEDLPAEIIIYLAQFLELADLLACSYVCRSWREAWTCGAVTASLCCRYFPGLTEMHNVSHSDGQQLFVQASKRYIDKYLRPLPNTYYSTRWFLGCNDLLNEEDMKEDVIHPSECLDFGPERFQMCYQDGILAWQPDESYVIINDLRQLLRRRCRFGSSLIAGRKLNLQQVTREIIVFSSVDLNAGTHKCRELQIWNMALGEWRRLSLPGRFAKCYAENSSVVALTSTGDAFYWTWGGPSVDLQPTPSSLTAPPHGCASCLQKVPGVIFHPTKTDTFFLCWVYKPIPVDHRIHVIVVVKYIASKPSQRYETTIQNPSRTAEPSNPYSDGILRFSLRCQKINNHGLVMLGAVETCLHFNRHKSTLAKSEWNLVCFNVLTETFMQRRYEKCLSSPRFHRPTWDWAESHDIQAWDDYLVVLWQPRPHVIHEPCTFTELLLAADNLACLSGDSAAFGDTMRPHFLEPALTIDMFHRRRSAVAKHVFMDDDVLVYAAPDSMLVSSLKSHEQGRQQQEQRVGDAPILTALDSLAVPRRIQSPPPSPPQTWDCEVYTTLDPPRLT